MHVVVAQAQVAVELEDLHLLLVLIGVAAERLEVGRAILLGRLFGGPLFLLRVLAGGAACPAAGRAEAAGAHLGGGRAGQQQQGGARQRQPETTV